MKLSIELVFTSIDWKEGDHPSRAQSCHRAGHETHIWFQTRLTPGSFDDMHNTIAIVNNIITDTEYRVESFRLLTVTNTGKKRRSHDRPMDVIRAQPSSDSARKAIEISR